MKLQLALVLLMGVSCFAAKARYDNYKLYSMQLTNEAQAEAVAHLEKNTDAYDFWSGPSMVRDVDVMVPPHKFGDFEDFLATYEITYQIKVENIQKLVDESDPELFLQRNPGARNTIDWTRFYTFAEINEWLNAQVSANPTRLTSTTYGTSHQGNPLRVIHFSERANNPAIFVECNMHAREWASSAFGTWLINELLYSTDPAVRSLAQTIDWYIVVVANPDGYIFSHTTTRLWRKTRQAWAGGCIGTDPNRNFDFFWMSGGASNNPCSDTYGGPAPWSEPETNALRHFYATIATRTRMFLSIHAFGQYILMPFGHTTANSNNHANLMSVANAGATAIRNFAGMDYLVGSTSVVLYTASGSSPDWAFGAHGTRLAYTYEVRPIRGSSNGFLLAPNQIIPNNRELVAGIVAMVARARELNEM